MTVLNSGDIHARVWVRIEEIRESLRMIYEILEGIPEGKISGGFDPPSKESSGFAVVEGWRGRSSTGSSPDPMGRSTAAWSETPQVSTGSHWNLRSTGILSPIFRYATRASISRIRGMIYKMKIPLNPPFQRGKRYPLVKGARGFETGWYDKDK